MKLYLWLVLLVTYSVAVVGFVLPVLFSAPSTIAVLVGFGLSVASIPLVVYLFKKVMNYV